ncbi:hypothetical protein WBJ53_27825 [Spirosoma sp. SC4-14]|uniref:hypothetical protein n=1 Tax=Spirosoma sp. SC4-14 TaxID=3128900 RepID=UPI0030D2B8C9
MKTKFLLIPLFVIVLLATVLGCKEDNPVIQTCLLTSTTDQLVETTGQLTDELKRTFSYTAGAVTSIAEKSKNQDATFTTTMVNGRITTAASAQDILVLAYGSTTSPTSCTFIRNSKTMSTFAMDYNASGQMTKLTESRLVLPTSSLTRQRVYTFTYDSNGNLMTERAQFTLTDGSVVTQETDYTFDAKPSPYKRFSELPLLTLVALSQAVETYPGRFWHINAPLTLKSYNLTSAGVRSNLRESSTFTPTYDSDSKLTSQDQTAMLYQSSVPDPVTKKNKQTFTYLCE